MEVDVRETSREPVLSDSARWLGAEIEYREPQWWEDLLDQDLNEKVRIRLGSQLHYLARLGVTVDRDMLRTAIDEAIEHGGNVEDVAECGSDEIIYYLRVGSLIKVGYTTCYAQRVRSYPPDSVLLANESGDRALERKRHLQFRHSLARGREWFYPTADLIEHINSLRDEPLTASQLAA